jgi:adenylate kinase family enzyme
MDRVLIAGVSGSGKTTVARALELRLGLPRYELDALHHGPGWVKRPEFEAEVEAFSAGERWVTEEQYHALLGDLLWQRADTLVWLDLPRATVMRQVVRRSFVRAALRRELWNGNRESFRRWLDPEHPIWWAWRRHPRKKIVTAQRIAAHPHVRVVRLTSARDARRWSAAPEIEWEPASHAG